MTVDRAKIYTVFAQLYCVNVIKFCIDIHGNAMNCSDFCRCGCLISCSSVETIILFSKDIKMLLTFTELIFHCTCPDRFSVSWMFTLIQQKKTMDKTTKQHLLDFQKTLDFQYQQHHKWWSEWLRVKNGERPKQTGNNCGWKKKFCDSKESWVSTWVKYIKTLRERKVKETEWDRWREREQYDDLWLLIV